MFECLPSFSSSDEVKSVHLYGICKPDKEILDVEETISYGSREPFLGVDPPSQCTLASSLQWCLARTTLLAGVDWGLH